MSYVFIMYVQSHIVWQMTLEVIHLKDIKDSANGIYVGGRFIFIFDTTCAQSCI